MTEAVDTGDNVINIDNMTFMGGTRLITINYNELTNDELKLLLNETSLVANKREPNETSLVTNNLEFIETSPLINSREFMETSPCKTVSPPV